MSQDADAKGAVSLDDLVAESARVRRGDEGDAERLAELARAATRLRVDRDGPAELLEATATLQDAALRAAAASGGEAETALHEELRELQAELEPRIDLEHDGPLLVTNVEDLRDWLGCKLPVRPQMALCRCGASATKPYCDGSYVAAGFRRRQEPRPRRRPPRPLPRPTADRARQPGNLPALRLLHGPPDNRLPLRLRALRPPQRRAHGRDHPSRPRLPLGGAQLRDRRRGRAGGGRPPRQPRALDRGDEGRPLPGHRRMPRSTSRAASRPRATRAPRRSTTRSAAAASPRTSRSAPACIGTSTSTTRCRTPTGRRRCSSGPAASPP